MRISQSTLGAADKCLLSAQYNLDRPSWYSKAAGAMRLVGTGYHAGLEQYYLERFNTGNNSIVPDLDVMIEWAYAAFDGGCQVDAYDGSPVERILWEERCPDAETGHSLIRAMLTEYVNGRNYWPPDWSVFGVEINQTVTDPVTGISYKLGADLALEDPQGWIVLVDHKTAGKAWPAGKHEPRKNDQASLYTNLAGALWPTAPGHRFVFDIMTYPGARTPPRFERRISDPQPAHMKAVIKKAEDFAALYETVHVQLGRDLPANPASNLCNPKFCDFFEGCPHGRALEAPIPNQTQGGHP